MIHCFPHTYPILKGRSCSLYLFLTLLVICQNNTEEERRSVHLLHAQTLLALGASWHELSFQVLPPLRQLLALCVGKDLLG